MSEHYRQRLRQLQTLLEPGMRRTLLVSFVLHLVIPLLLSGVLKITHKTPSVPVYRVNLVNKPVKDPRAGRPDAVAKKKTQKVSKPKKKPAKIIAKKKPTQPKTVKKKSVRKPKKTAPAVKNPDQAAQKALKKRLAELKAEAERQERRDALKAAIAAQQDDLGRPDDKTPVGDPEGTGVEIGVSSLRYIEAFIAEKWRLSPYQSPLDLEAEVRVTYSAEGKQGYWEITKASGNGFFDDSVKRAVIRAKDLGQALPAAETFEIVFNLKDLQNR